MDVSLAWGKGRVDLSIPSGNFAGLVKPRDLSGGDLSGLARALDRPMGRPLEKLCEGRKVCVLIEDDTRTEPHKEIIDSLAGRLRGARQTTFIVATGSHNPTTAGNRRVTEMVVEASSREGLNLAGVYVNDCFSDDFVNLGRTGNGTELNVNRVALDADLYVVGADMKNHYFAGYSNALKDFLPGICNYSTIEANHALALDPRSTFGVHPWHPDPKRRDNPLAKDILEAQRIICGRRPVLVLAALTSHSRLLWSGAGGIKAVTGKGIAAVDELTSFRVPSVSHAVVSPGGYPQDDTLYNAQSALELTKNAVLDGGRVLLLAACAQGIAPNDKAKQNFYDRLTMPLDEVLASIKRRYELYSHKAYKFAELIRKRASIEIYTELGDDVLTKAHMSKADDPQAVMDRWIREDPRCKIMFFDDASKLAVYAE